MAIDNRDDVLAAAPAGTTVSSSYRTPEHNAAVGGVPGSEHTKGSPGNPHALDLVPPPGMSMGQLNQHLAQSGLNLRERLNEGDHVHVAFDGQPRRPGEQPNPGYEVKSSQDLAPTDTPESLRAQGYEIDPVRNVWARTVGSQVGVPDPLDNSYADRQAARESMALDQEQADAMMAIQFASPLDMAGQAVGGVAKDVGKGVFLEGGQAVVSGVKRGVNAVLDMSDAAGDFIDVVEHT